MLEGWLEKHDVAVATFLKPDATDRVTRWRTYGLHWPTNRHAGNLLRNSVLAIKTMLRERPDLVISSGAGGAVPFFYLARLFPRTHTVFVECYDRIDLPTLTARLVRPVTDLFIVQWPTQLPSWSRRVELGPSR